LSIILNSIDFNISMVFVSKGVSCFALTGWIADFRFLFMVVWCIICHLIVSIGVELVIHATAFRHRAI